MKCPLTERGCGGCIELSVPYTDADGAEKTAKITLRQQNGKWLLDSPTY